MSGHVFISYSQLDRAYVDRLADHLRGEGVDVWYDRELEPGVQFDAVIENAIDASAAVIVVLTPTAASSRWVRNEVIFAQDHGKSVHPLLLLECERPILLRDVHYEDVRGGVLPRQAFVDVLRGRVNAAGGATAEPGSLRPALPARVGIDLGTVESYVSVYDRSVHRPVMVAGEDLIEATPSVARQDSRGRVLIGASAVIHGILDPGSSIVDNTELPVLTKLRRDVKLRAETSATAATIVTAPAADGSSVLAAAKQAGIIAAQLLGPHAAAALAARFERPRSRQTALIVQVRKGHAGACLATAGPDRVEVNAAVMDVDLGTRHWDDRVAEYLATSTPGSDWWDETARQRVYAAAGRVRGQLSTMDEAELFLPLIAAGSHLTATVDRTLFARLTSELADRLGEMLRQIATNGLDRVTLLGEGSEMPGLREVVGSTTGLDPQPSTLSHPIAMAAAWWAAVTAGDVAGPTLTDHTVAGA